MICDTCKHKDVCKENMEAYGVPFVRIDECKEYERGEKMNNDLISRSALVQHAFTAEFNGKPIDVVALVDVDNAPTVKAFTEEDMAGAYNEGYMCGSREAEKARPQGDLADEVWKLYKKHQSHLATHVLEFGDELKDLLGKYQKGGAK